MRSEIKKKMFRERRKGRFSRKKSHQAFIGPKKSPMGF